MPNDNLLEAIRQGKVHWTPRPGMSGMFLLKQEDDTYQPIPHQDMEQVKGKIRFVWDKPAPYPVKIQD